MLKMKYKRKRKHKIKISDDARPNFLNYNL